MDNYKVLLLFPESLKIHNRVAFLSTVFQEQYDEKESIVRDVRWRTKYYDIKFDIYVDTYDAFEEWAVNFAADECKELRDVLSGMIFVFEDKNHEPVIDCIKGIIDETFEDFTNKFFIGCLFNESTIIEDDLYELNNDLIIQNLEIVNWFDKAGPSMDRVGSERIKEIIDVHPWPCNAQTIKSSQEHVDSKSNDLGSFIAKLEKAKQKYQTINNNTEAEEFLESMIEELSDMIV
ncbi:unnamed protein product [Kluyveromyces dobzhanskii CBS 2104]|uniref:Increased recombination centers protein 6 n=1 Tax=Kluyveromyces dobzhanskii CBS 2104 TaxID=1427455 RepID=A0A0A8L0J5_9SACH|nr:unnamed protein product [Kluyveromyces dobzhanskii CBS 2104]